MAISEAQKQEALIEIKAALRRAHERYADLRNAATAATHKATQAEVERVLEEQRKEGDKPVDAALVGLSATAAIANQIPVVGQVISIIAGVTARHSVLQ
jgi:hypothetical protein